MWSKRRLCDNVMFVADQLRQYFTQLRQEVGLRLVEKVFGSEDKPSKVSIDVNANTVLSRARAGK